MHSPCACAGSAESSDENDEEEDDHDDSDGSESGDRSAAAGLGGKGKAAGAAPGAGTGRSNAAGGGKNMRAGGGGARGGSGGARMPHWAMPETEEERKASGWQRLHACVHDTCVPSLSSLTLAMCLLSTAAHQASPRAALLSHHANCLRSLLVNCTHPLTKPRPPCAYATACPSSGHASARR